MEPVSNLKRQVNEVDLDQCIICQSEKTDKLRIGGAQGIETIRCAQELLKKNDNSNRDSILGLSNVTTIICSGTVGVAQHFQVKL